jgi:hypothetical protein
MTDLELKLLLGHCETAGLHENGGFGYSVKDPRWDIPENYYHFLIIYPSDGSITVETWHECGDEAEASREMQNPTLKDVFEEMQKQGRELSFVVVKKLSSSRT